MSMVELASSGDAKNFIREMRVRSLYSNYYFSKAVLQNTRLTDYFHMPEMESFIHNWANGIRKQAIEWSRAFYKSTSFTISTSIWKVLPFNDDDSEYAIMKLKISERDWFRMMNLHDQDARQLLAFEVDTNARLKIGQIKWHFEENELFRAVFPEIAYTGTEQPWTNQSLRIRRVGEGRRESEGTFDAIGVGGALQSRHYNTIWEDDLVGKKARDSETVMNSTIEWHTLLNGAFVDATKQERFLVSNRWGFNDLNSWVRKNEPDYVFHTRSAIEINNETGEEEAVFPVNGVGDPAYTIEELNKIAKTMSRQDFACQYLNRAIPPGEQEIDVNALHHYEVLDGEIVCSCGAKFRPTSLLRYIHYDPYNAKGNDSKSCPAIAVVGTSTDRHVFLLSYFTAKTSYAKIFDKIFELNDKWRPAKFSYEDVGNQNMAEFYIKEKEKNDPAHLKIHRRMPVIKAVTTKGKAKEVRIRDYLLNFIRTCKFSCKKEHALFQSQLETFPYSVPDHDYDLLDALAQGASLPWTFPFDEPRINEEKRQEDEYLKKFNQPYSHVDYAQA